MSKGELKNAIVEMNMLKLISDKELIMLNDRINKHFLNSSHPDETTKVSTNELTKEVGCINCIRHYSPNSKDCKTCDENYSNYNQLVGSAPSKGDL